MKIKKSALVFVSLLCMVLPSCSPKDELVEVSTSNMQAYGLNFELSHGIIWESNKNSIAGKEPYIYYDTYIDADGNEVTDEVVGFTRSKEVKETGNFQLSLYEKGLTYNQSLGNIEGRGACISFQLNSAEINKLTAGKYVYTAESKSANTFIGYSSVLYDTQKAAEPAEITQGDVTIGNTGETYHIQFKGQTLMGTDISCEYKGTLVEQKVKQLSSALYSDISLAGLLDTVVIENDLWGEIEIEKVIDSSNGKAFFSTTTGTSQLANAAGKEKVDIALRWDSENQSFVFESPIRMRSWLGHSDKYNFPCHTTFMKAPESFGDEDFQKLEETGFSFAVLDEKVEIDTKSFTESYVFFEAGNGVKGVMHVKRFTPLSKRVDDVWGMIITRPINPTIIMDIKCPANFLNPKIR